MPIPTHDTSVYTDPYAASVMQPFGTGVYSHGEQTFGDGIYDPGSYYMHQQPAYFDQEKMNNGMAGGLGVGGYTTPEVVSYTAY